MFVIKLKIAYVTWKIHMVIIYTWDSHKISKQEMG